MSLEDSPYSNNRKVKNSFSITFTPILLPLVYNI